MTQRVYWVVYVVVGRFGATTKRRQFDTEGEARTVAARYDAQVIKVTEEVQP